MVGEIHSGILLTTPELQGGQLGLFRVGCEVSGGEVGSFVGWCRIGVYGCTGT